MIRYFFDVVTDGKVNPDEEGLLLPNTASARREASLFLVDFARDRFRFRSDQSIQQLAISVRTVDGPVCEAAIFMG
ncbi:hypothetical protein JQ609_23935 [Bradyrhizobium sp. AUGA SZCCT0169]|uniref:DUF6894 family protein n=1 Tax=Bradyrhizobium sp. AUGA SZCCT0169 TaxID=2807663 RepID=UPI001BA5FFA9|nr:hypothetical protein [Bradyrhizobium sp. AUGA SZCCT0169]MBR1249964.1 hypothetical protein [Bradyrhizobium sp. AUGA SZCCT0169]